MKNHAEYRAKLDRLFSENSNKDIFQCMNPKGEIRSTTYGKLDSDIRRFEKNILNLHLCPGDRILILDNHTPSVMQMFLTVSYWNLTPVLMDPGIPSDEMNHMIETLDLSAVFTNRKLYDKLWDSVRNETPIYDIRGTENDYPEICSGLPTASGKRKVGEGNPDLAVIVLSSGTTSRMKAIEISYHAFLTSIEQDIRVSGIKKDNLLLVFPLFHVSGLDSAMTVLLQGNTLMMVDEFRPAELQQILQIFQPEAFGMVPKVFELMVQRLEQELDKKSRAVQLYYRLGLHIASFFNRKLGMPFVGKILMRPFATALFGKRIRILAVGSSACDPKTAEVMINMGLRWFYVYASTECGVPITSVTAEDHYPCDTVGKADSVENVTIMIHNPDIYGVGEIYVRTDQIMNGYFRDPELTEKSFEQGFFKTGDLGYIDHAGYLHITGRSKETILLQTGKKISPDDLDHVLTMIRPQYEAVSCGVPDQESGFDRIYIFVVDRHYTQEEKENCQKNIRELFRQCAAQYPIEQIQFINEIPKTAVGKVKRTLLRENVLNENTKTQTSGSEKENDAYEEITDDELQSWILSLFYEGEEINGSASAKIPWRESGGMDSLKLMEILVRIEKKTGVFLGEKIGELETVEDIVSYIRECRNPMGKEGKNIV